MKPKAKGPELEKRIHIRVPHTPEMRGAIHDVTAAIHGGAVRAKNYAREEAIEQLSTAMRLALEPEQLEVVPELKKAGELTFAEVQQWLRDENASLHISCRAGRAGKKIFIVAVNEEEHKSSDVWTDDLVHGLKTIMADF